MKKSIRPHDKNIGPGVSLDLDDVSVIEEFGDRSSSAGWVQAVITLRHGKVLNIKLSVTDMDELVLEWKGTIPKE